MIKLTFCLRRAPHLSAEDFHRYWLDQHGPLVRSHLKAIGACRYAQIHAIDDEIGRAVAAVRGAPEPFDGIAEMWWESREAMVAPMQTPEGRAAGRALLEDEKRFIDLAHSPLWLNEVYEYTPE